MEGATELASDERINEATGRGWEAWFPLLDRWGAKQRKRREIVDVLIAEYAVPGWWAQAISTGYERTRGMRRQWLTDGAMSLRTSQPDKVARFDWAGGPTRVMVTFEDKGASKATAYVTHERLPDPDAAEMAKASWKKRVAALKSLTERVHPDPSTETCLRSSLPSEPRVPLSGLAFG